METSINAGRLDQRLEVQELAEAEPGSMDLENRAEDLGPGGAEHQAEPVLRSGDRSPGAELILRRQELTLHNALLWGGRHLFLTAIRPEGRLHLRVEAALDDWDTVQLHTDEETVERAFLGS